jgi:hypothetical protein
MNHGVYVFIITYFTTVWNFKFGHISCKLNVVRIRATGNYAEKWLADVWLLITMPVKLDKLINACEEK